MELLFQNPLFLLEDNDFLSILCETELIKMMKAEIAEMKKQAKNA